MTTAAPPTVVTLSEWQTCHLDGRALATEDRELAASLAGTGGGRVVIDELRSGLRVSARSWVGVVRFKGFELRIVPKLVGGDVGLVRLIDFASGLDALGRHPADHTFEASGPSLLDLVALLLAESCERIARNGLLADYRETEADLPVLRGRLLPRKQLIGRMGRIDRLECRFDEHTTDTTDNQLLLAALSVCGSRVRDGAVALRVRRLLAVFTEACELDGLDLRATRSELTYNRLNEHYREAHGLAWLILDGLGIDDLYSGGSHRTFAFLLDMNRLFEDFVERWLGQLVRGTGLHILPQRRDRTILWNADLDRPYSQVVPDLLVERSSRPGLFLPLDAKYKLYDDSRLSPSDIYQTFLYAYAYGHHDTHLPTSVILYPSSAPLPGGVRVHVRRQTGVPTAELRAVGISIPSVLDEAIGGRTGSLGRAMLEMLSAKLPICQA